MIANEDGFFMGWVWDENVLELDSGTGGTPLGKTLNYTL